MCRGDRVGVPHPTCAESPQTGTSGTSGYAFLPWKKSANRIPSRNPSASRCISGNFSFSSCVPAVISFQIAYTLSGHGWIGWVHEFSDAISAPITPVGRRFLGDTRFPILRLSPQLLVPWLSRGPFCTPCSRLCRLFVRNSFLSVFQEPVKRAGQWWFCFPFHPSSSLRVQMYPRPLWGIMERNVREDSVCKGLTEDYFS